LEELPVRTRRLGWLAWSLWALTMALEVTAIWLWLGNRSRGVGYFAPQVFVVPGFATVGALIAARRANTVGWLFLGLGFIAALHAFSMAYAERDDLIDPASLPADSLIGPLTGWLWPLNYFLLALILLLFPDGRLPSPRWRPAARFILVAWGASIVLNALGPGNPLGAEATSRATTGSSCERRRVGRARDLSGGPLSALSPRRLPATPAAQMGRLHRRDERPQRAGEP
jgi:hypothetical protein